ncbi:10904_t:CDS:1 [Dentiscutata erythropus]|uniref:10904_t:CDS:1 n=1 Tax=Dentiscutata erythropus TaxID=1348616 RepID=A0A9N8WBR2_9GLOM|nr:10904_t:CDS:1 [Dentiscutata erythropus]
MNKSKPINSFMIYRAVVHNFFKAKNIKYSCSTVSKIASKLWKNESVDVKNVYKQLAETTKYHEKNFESELINNVENLTSLVTTTTNVTPSVNTEPILMFLQANSESILDVPSVNTEPILYVQFPAFPININSPQIINDIVIISMQTLNFQYNHTIVSLNIEPINVKPFL